VDKTHVDFYQPDISLDEGMNPIRNQQLALQDLHALQVGLHNYILQQDVLQPQPQAEGK